eukprot:scaffold630_cov174-Amphora_coffeaeformis.AAC.8
MILHIIIIITIDAIVLLLVQNATLVLDVTSSVGASVTCSVGDVVGSHERHHFIDHSSVSKYGRRCSIGVAHKGTLHVKGQSGIVAVPLVVAIVSACVSQDPRPSNISNHILTTTQFEELRWSEPKADEFLGILLATRVSCAHHCDIPDAKQSRLPWRLLDLKMYLPDPEQVNCHRLA